MKSLGCFMVSYWFNHLVFCTSLKKKVCGMNISSCTKVCSNPASTTLHIAGQMEIYGSLMFMGSWAMNVDEKYAIQGYLFFSCRTTNTTRIMKTFSVGKSQPKPGFQQSKQMASTCHCHETKQVACMGNRWPTFEQKCLSYMVEGVTRWCVDSFPFQ